MRYQSEKRSMDSHHRRKFQDQPTKFIKTVERHLTDHPQIGAVILGALVIACGRITEFIAHFEEQLKSKVEELRHLQQMAERTSKTKHDSKPISASH